MHSNPEWAGVGQTSYYLDMQFYLDEVQVEVRLATARSNYLSRNVWWIPHLVEMPSRANFVWEKYFRIFQKLLEISFSTSSWKHDRTNFERGETVRTKPINSDARAPWHRGPQAELPLVNK